MNLIDLFVIAVLAFFMLSGIYRGFLPSVLLIGVFIVSWACGIIFMPLVANSVKSNETLFNMLLYYTEGSEFVGDVELARKNIDSLSPSQISAIADNPKLPYPYAKEIQENVAKQAFRDMNITTLGDYYNQTIVCVAVNILSFLLIFLVTYIILSYAVHAFEYAVRLPKLTQFNIPISAGCGFLKGILMLFAIFMVVPLILIAMQFDFLHQMLDNSVFAPFFYHMSFLLGLMPGV